MVRVVAALSRCQLLDAATSAATARNHCSMCVQLDLVDEEALIRSEADIRAINSGVNIVRTSRAVVDLGLILNRNGYR